MHLLFDLRLALRSLARRPAFTLVAAGTLALGIGATTAIFSVAYGVLLRPLPYRDADRLVSFWEVETTEAAPEPGGNVSHPNFLDLRSTASSFESMAQYERTNLSLSGLGTAEIVPGGAVTPGFFRVFRAAPVLGRGFDAAEGRPGGPDAVVVSESFWRERLGADPAVLGTTLDLSGTPHRVVGVAPAGFAFPADARLWVPIQNDDEKCGRGCVLYKAVGRLAPGAGVERARRELRAIMARLEREYPDTNTHLSADALSLHDLIVGDVRPALLLLLGAVAMVLLIACANVANLLLVRGGARRAEIAVRGSLGAGRGRLLTGLMLENALLAAAGGGAGVALAAWGVDVLRRLGPADLPRLDEVRLDAPALLFAVVVMVATVALFGLAPALRLSRPRLGELLRPGGRGTPDPAGRRLRAAVLTAEVALSVMLLLAAGLMLRSLVRMSSLDLGLEPAGVAHFTLSLPRARYAGADERLAFLDRLEGRLAALPGVERVAAFASLPLTPVDLVGGFTRADRPEPAPGEGPSAGYRAVDPGGLELLGVPLLAGRGFAAADRHGAAPVALINRAAAQRYWPGEDPVGKRIQLQIQVGYPEAEPRTIVGVVGDLRTELTVPPRPEMYVPYAQVGASFPTLVLKVRGGDPAGVLGPARRVVSELDPELPMARPGRLQDGVDAALAPTAFYLGLLGLFAALAVTLAAVGIYGVVAYLVVQRTREIGVRMALGARVREVVGLVVWQGLRPAAAGLVLGLAGAMALGRLVADALFEVAPTDPLTYAAACAGLLVVVAVATALPARRATRIAPADALRAE